MKGRGRIITATGSLIFTLILVLIALKFYVVPVFALSDFQVQSNPHTITVPDSNEPITFIITNNDGSKNITQVNITIPSSFIFIANSNSTTASNTQFSNTSTVVSWKNTTVTGFVTNSSPQNFTINVSSPNFGGSYNFTITTLDTSGVQNSTNVTIEIFQPVVPGTLPASWADDPSNPPFFWVNISNHTDYFFADGMTVFMVANFTSPILGVGVPGLNVTGNFSAIGASESVPAIDLGNGIYELNATINYSAIGAVGPIQPALVNIFVKNGTGTVNMSQYGGGNAPIILVNMSTLPSCPPENDPNALPQAIFWNGSMKSVINCTAASESICNGQIGPVQFNDTHVVLCGPVWGPETTNFTAIAANPNGNFSNVPLVLQIPGIAKINFTQGVDFAGQQGQKAQAVMEFAMKNLIRGGKIGVNESEWDGTNITGRYKPNLVNISTRLTLYNLSGLLGISDPAIFFGNFNGFEDPSSLSTCPFSRCSNIDWDGENLTFTVSSFSTYVIGNTTHKLVFQNLTALTSTVVTKQNATYLVNITNLGNATQETYNLSVSGFGTLNVSSITLNQSESIIVELDVSNSSAAVGLTSIIVANYWNGTGTETSWNLNSSEDNVTFNTTVIAPLIKITAPTSNQNLTSTSGIVLNFTTNTNLNTSECHVLLNGTVISGASCSNQTIKSGNFTEGLNQNFTVVANDTYGNNYINDSVTFNIDNTAPESVSITLPSANANISGILTVNATATDSGTGIYSVKFNLTNSTGSSVNVTTMSSWGTAGNYTGNISTTGFSNGIYTITVIATDYSGNSNSTQKINITIDNTAPAVVLISPSAGTYPAQNLTINASVNETTTSISSVRYNISNSSWSNVAQMTATGNYYNATLDTSTLANGNYTIRILANDTAGNINNTEKVIITVDLTPPQLTQWNYSFITKQLTLQFSENININSLNLAGFNITYNDGSTLEILTGLSSATTHTSTNSSTIVINFTAAMDEAMQNLRGRTEGQIDMAAGSVNDIAGNDAGAKANLAYNTYKVYGIEIDLTKAIWNSFNLPRTVLENRTSLNSNYTVQSVLSSIAGNYRQIFYYDGSSWTSYVPGRATNDFTTFTDDTGTNAYWIYMNATDKLQII